MAVAAFIWKVEVFRAVLLPHLSVPGSATGFWYWNALASGLTGGLVIYALAFGGGLLGWLLSRPVLVYLGEVSFAIYLTHAIVINEIEKLSTGFLGFALYVPAVLVVSAILYEFVEKPAQRLLRGKGSQRPAHTYHLGRNVL